ncbi:MAG: hypothetical protein IIZ36_02640, partial [Ruminococcus sp.]|nr:hypothetical protein [Ruminococcus sp.]
MIKKLACAALATLLVAGTSAVVAGAAESDEAVAVKSEAEAVGADETDSDVGAEADSESTGSDSVIYFDASSTSWSSDTIKQGVFFFLRDFKEGQIITWGSKKGKMTDEGGGKYSYDLGEKGIELQSGHNYAVNFAAGSTWGVQTCDLIFGEECFGHTASCTGEMVENNMDSNKKSEYVIWDNGVDRTKYAPPMIVTSIGNIVGEVPLTTKYDLMVQFLKETLTNAREYAQKSDQELLDGIAEKLGLSQSEVERAINEAGVSVDWK